jgi:hypothetical protein
MPVSQRLEDLLTVRGFRVSDDEGFARMVPWTRLTFLLCSAIVAVATAFAFMPALWAMVPIAAVGALTPRHPFDHIYNYGVRRLTGTRPLPPNGAPTRFACVLATAWLIATAIAFESGTAWLGYTLGFALVGVAMLVGTVHVCIPSIIYQLAVGDRALVRRALLRRSQPPGR